MRGPLIEAADLALRLEAEDWVPVDCRFDLLAPEQGQAEYAEGHIPGARYAHLDRDLSRAPVQGEGRHPLPDPLRLAARLGEWGIDRDTAVVAYDAQGGAIAARLWWLLRWLGHERVYLLNGGLAAWQRLGMPLDRTLPNLTPRHYDVREPNRAAVVTADALPALQREGVLLVDVRAAPRYRGDQEPIDPVAGHVSGAVNRPFTANLGGDGRFLAPDLLRQSLEPLLAGRPAAEIVAMCGSGVTACHLLVALEAAGLGQGRLFAGSWSEWIRDPARPIRTGPDP